MAGPLIRRYAAAQRKSKQPVTVRGLQRWLAGKGHDLSRDCLRRTMRRCGFSFSHPRTKRTLGHETLHNRAYRVKYLERMEKWGEDAMSARRRGGCMSLVMLDESYAHQFPEYGKVWHEDGYPVELPSSKGLRYNIIGAIAYDSIHRTGPKRGVWTGGHLLQLDVWKGNAKAKSSVKRLKVGDAEDASAAPAPVGKHVYAEGDYHGNMNSEFFEEWLDRLCAKLASDPKRYGRCLLKMDGAK